MGLDHRMLHQIDGNKGEQFRTTGAVNIQAVRLGRSLLEGAAGQRLFQVFDVKNNEGQDEQWIIS